jgi:ribonuclease HI
LTQAARRPYNRGLSYLGFIHMATTRKGRPMPEPPTLTIYTDGASRGNPGAGAYAYVISREGEPDIAEADCLGRMTNNQAEYTALIRALEHALELGAEHQVVVYSDSELMVKQMSGHYAVKNADLRPLYEEARDLARELKGGVTFRHVPRALNSRADALCNEALDGKRVATPRASTVQAMKAPPTAAKTTLREEALSCLRRAHAAWSRGATAPTPEEVWEQLTEALARHGVQRG